MSKGGYENVSRRQAREEALSLLYEMEMGGQNLQTTLASKPLAPAKYALAIVDGVSQNAKTYDARINALLHGWTTERLAVIDRLLARIAAWEILESKDVPCGVVLNETVELASQYSTPSSARFLNGVLGALAQQRSMH